jgi:hypothetical protein
MGFPERFAVQDGVLRAALVNGLLTPPTQVSTHYPTQAMANFLFISVG